MIGRSPGEVVAAMNVTWKTTQLCGGKRALLGRTGLSSWVVCTLDKWNELERSRVGTRERLLEAKRHRDFQDNERPRGVPQETKWGWKT